MPKSLIKSIGTELRRRRDELSLSQETCALKIDVTRTAWTRWENGVAEPNITRLQQACKKIFKCTLAEFFDGIGF